MKTINREKTYLQVKRILSLLCKRKEETMEKNSEFSEKREATIEIGEKNKEIIERCYDVLEEIIISSRTIEEKIDASKEENKRKIPRYILQFANGFIDEKTKEIKEKIKSEIDPMMVKSMQCIEEIKSINFLKEDGFYLLWRKYFVKERNEVDLLEKELKELAANFKSENEENESSQRRENSTDQDPQFDSEYEQEKNLKKLESENYQLKEEIEMANNQIEELARKNKQSQTSLTKKEEVNKKLRGEKSKILNEKDKFDTTRKSLEEELQWSISWKRNPLSFILCLVSLLVSFYLLTQYFTYKIGNFLKRRTREIHNLNS